MPAEDQARLVATPPTTVDAFTNAILIAEGFDPVLVEKDRRREVSQLVARYFAYE